MTLDEFARHIDRLQKTVNKPISTPEEVRERLARTEFLRLTVMENLPSMLHGLLQAKKHWQCGCEKDGEVCQKCGWMEKMNRIFTTTIEN